MSTELLSQLKIHQIIQVCFSVLFPPSFFLFRVRISQCGPGKVTSTSQRSACLCLAGAGIRGVQHHASRPPVICLREGTFLRGAISYDKPRIWFIQKVSVLKKKKTKKTLKTIFTYQGVGDTGALPIENRVVMIKTIGQSLRREERKWGSLLQLQTPRHNNTQCGQRKKPSKCQAGPWWTHL